MVRETIIYKRVKVTEISHACSDNERYVEEENFDLKSHDKQVIQNFINAYQKRNDNCSDDKCNGKTCLECFMEVYIKEQKETAEEHDERILTEFAKWLGRGKCDCYNEEISLYFLSEYLNKLSEKE